MGKKILSTEAIAELRKNPHVVGVINSHQVIFTQKFKEFAYQQLLVGDRTMREILEDCGVDTTILGKARIKSFAYDLRRAARTGKLFTKGISHHKIDATDEEKELMAKRCELRNNPYVFSVENDKVVFTDEFKDLACQKLLEEGKTARQILKDFGFDTRIFSGARIQNFAVMLRKRCARLREQGVTNTKNCYDVSQKEPVVRTNSMETNNSHDMSKAISGTIQRTERHKNALTREECITLQNNPCVASATEYVVQFTEEFKELAYQEFVQGEKTMREILQEHGIDPKILGFKRIANFSSRLQEKARKNQGFGDARKRNKRRPRLNPTDERRLTDRIRSLEHELAYTRQEVEFLKKTQKTDMEARMSWGSKHRQKKNSL